MPTHLDPQPHVIRDRDAERVQDGATSEIVLLADGADTQARLTINRAALEIGSPGAPAHTHEHTSEALFVIDGALDVLVGAEIQRLGPGDLAVIPPGVVHAFAPSSGSRADLLAVFTPGQGRFAYYRRLERLYRGSADLAELQATADRYDNHYATSPVWQRR